MVNANVTSFFNGPTVQDTQCSTVTDQVCNTETERVCNTVTEQQCVPTTEQVGAGIISDIIRMHTKKVELLITGLLHRERPAVRHGGDGAVCGRAGGGVRGGGAGAGVPDRGGEQVQRHRGGGVV